MVTWKIKKLISALQQHLWQSNLAGWWLRVGAPSTKSRERLTKWLRGHYSLNAFKTSVAIVLIILSLLSVVLSRWENNFDTILFNFSELLPLEITKSNDVQICQFILIRRNQTCFFHGHIISIYTTHLTYDSSSKKM